MAGTEQHQDQNLGDIFQAGGSLDKIPGGNLGNFNVRSVSQKEMQRIMEERSFDVVPQMPRKEFIDEFKGDPWSVFDAAYSRGMSMDAYSNIVAPPTYGDDMNMLMRLSLECGYMLYSNPRQGFWADPVGKFFKDQQGHVFLTEYINGLHRHINYYQPQWMTRRNRRREALRQRYAEQFAPGEIIESTDSIPGSIDLPWYDSMMLRYSQLLEMQVPLSMLTSRQENIMGGDWREPEIELKRGARTPRLGQGDTPQVRSLTVRDQAARLYKRALAVRVTDEAMRRCRIDRLGEEFAISMINDNIAKVYEACDVIYNGDENDGTAAHQYDPHEIDAAEGYDTGQASGKTPSFDLWVGWKQEVKFESVTRIDLIFGDMSRTRQFLKIPTGLTGDPVHISSDYTMDPNIDMFQPVPENPPMVYYIDIDTSLLSDKSGDDDGNPQFDDDIVCAINQMFGGITLIEEIGGTFTEQQREILRGSNIVVSTETYGMSKRQKGKAASFISYDRADY